MITTISQQFEQEPRICPTCNLKCKDPYFEICPRCLSDLPKIEVFCNSCVHKYNCSIARSKKKL